jgi:hypothetical protein
MAEKTLRKIKGSTLNFVETLKLKTPISPSPLEKVWDEAIKKGFLAFE